MDNLEKSFKEQLSGFDEISPSEGLWSRISTSLLLRSGWFRAGLLSLLILAIGLPVVWMSDKENRNTEVNNQEIIKPGMAQSSLVKESQTNQNTSQNTHQVLSKNSQTTAPQASISTQHKTVQNSEGITDIPTNKKSIAENVTYDRENTNTDKTSVISNKKQTADSDVKSTDSEQQSRNDVLSDSHSQNALVASTTISAKQVANKPSEGSAALNNLRTEPEPEFSHTESAKSRNREYVEKIDFLAIHNSENVNAENQGASPYRLIPIQQIYSRIEIFAGPNIAFSSFKVDNSVNSDYISIRENGESPKLSYHFGINYKTYYNKWFIGSGISYHQISDRADYSLPGYDVDTSISRYMVFNRTYKYVITGYIPNPNDTSSMIPVYDIQVKEDTTFVSDVHYDSTEVQKSYSFNNTYRYIEVPLIIGRSFNYKHFVFDITAGISWNHLVGYQVLIPDPQQKRLIDLQEQSDNLQYNVFNGLLGLGIGYRVNEGQVLFIRPDMRYNLNSIFDANYPVNQKYLQWRLSLGMRLKL